MMLHTHRDMDRIDHHYDSDAAYYQDNLIYCLRRRRRVERQARSAARRRGVARATAFGPVTLLRRVWRRWQPHQPI